MEQSMTRVSIDAEPKARARRTRLVPAAATAAVYALLAVWVVAVVFPLAWVVVNAFRSSQEIFNNPFGIPWLFTGVPERFAVAVPDAWASARYNFHGAWVRSHFSDFFVNSLVVTGVSLAGILLFSAMAAYVLARFPFRGNRLLFLYFASGLMVPAQLVLVPLFFQFSAMSRWGSMLLAPLGLELRLHDSLTGLILIYIALSLPFTILVLTGFFKSLPGTLREAGIIDGCSEYGVFRHIMMPLAKPGLVTAAIFNFLGLWNEYLFALVFVNSAEKKTLPLGLASVSLQAQYKTDYGLMFAGLVIVLIPTLAVYLLLQRQLTRGITVGALKG
jgi:N-acetylglucosamine transport system permease protein